MVQPASLAVLAHHIGAPRFETYRKIALNHNYDAVRMYRWNLEMSGALHEALGLAEVFLRNAIDRELRVWNAAQPLRRGSPTFGPEWVKNPAGPLYAVLNPPSSGKSKYRFSTYDDARKRAQKDLTERPLGHRRHGHPVDHDDLVAHMTFGTWKKLLAKKNAAHPSGVGPYAQRRLWTEAIVRAFPHHPSPAVIYYWVDRLHTLRNRVAHAEPLCDTDVMSYHRTIVRRGGGKSPIDLDVEIAGPISRVERVNEVLDRLYEFEEEEFSKPRKPVEDSLPSALLVPSVFGRAQPPSPEERARRLEAWRSEKSAHIDQGREHFLGVAVPGVGIRVVSRDRFVAKPHLIVAFHHCESFNYREADDADYRKVVEPIVRRQDPYGIGFDPSDLQIAPRGYPVGWTNHGNNVEVTLTPESFRPNVPWTSDQDDYVLLARDPQADVVTVTWVLTEDGNDAVTRGKLKVPTGDLTDAVDCSRQHSSKTGDCCYGGHHEA